METRYGAGINACSNRGRWLEPNAALAPSLLRTRPSGDLRRMSETHGYQRLFAEFKRRKVFRVMAVYGAAGFILLQVVELLVPALLLPEWTYRFITLLLIIVVPFGREFYAIQLPGLVMLLAAGGIVGASGGVIYFSLRTMGWLQQVPQVRAIVEESEIVLPRVEKKVVEIAGPVVKRAGARVRHARRNTATAVKAKTLGAGRRVVDWVRNGSGPGRPMDEGKRNPPGD